MKTIIAGGRYYRESDYAFSLLDEYNDALGGITEVVSGGAPGADAIGEEWATKNGIPIKKFEALWHQGKGAGPIRNQKMARYAEALILFPGGPGSKNMLRNARKRNLIIIDVLSEMTLSILKQQAPQLIGVNTNHVRQH
jgi:hypothetical protein